MRAGIDHDDVPAGSPGTCTVPRQGSFDDLGIPLAEVTFVVVDLETTGASPATSHITEIGAVRVRGGEVLGQFQSLVRPGEPIPAFIAVLTGITDRLVASAPRIEAVLPAFLEFLGSEDVLVAHNAPFDVGFLRTACAATGHPWPAPAVLDTARLARAVLTRDEAPDCKLATLARLFRASTAPEHRALADARATVDVLHGLLERIGCLGVHTREELLGYSGRVHPDQRRKRHLAEGLPSAPGVYLFRDGRGRVLYVGTSRDLRTRVRTYFTGSETRSRMGEMVRLAESVTPVVCPTALEARVRELRLIAEHDPPYNRRSRRPERSVWLRITDEPFPRLSLVRSVRGDGAGHLGPFGSVGLAEQVRAALHEAVPVRQCTERLSPRRPRPACVLAEMGRCGAPCEGRERPADYAAHVAALREAFHGDTGPVVLRLRRRITDLAAAERYEDAAVHRDRLAALVRAADRMQRLVGLGACAEVVAARPTADLGWELVCVRFGRLAGSAVVPRGVDPWPAVAALRRTAEVVAPCGPSLVPGRAASAEETECVLQWIDQPGTRLVHVEGTWVSPVRAAAAYRSWVVAARRAPDQAQPPGEPSGPRPVHRPAALGR